MENSCGRKELSPYPSKTPLFGSAPSVPLRCPSPEMTHCVFGNKRLLRYLNACFSSACELPSLAKGPVCLVNDLECKWLSARLTFSLLGTRQVEFCGPPEICSLPAICPPTCGNWAQPVLSVCVLFPSGGRGFGVSQMRWNRRCWAEGNSCTASCVVGGLPGGWFSGSWNSEVT